MILDLIRSKVFLSIDTDDKHHGTSVSVLYAIKAREFLPCAIEREGMEGACAQRPLAYVLVPTSIKGVARASWKTRLRKE